MHGTTVFHFPRKGVMSIEESRKLRSSRGIRLGGWMPLTLYFDIKYLYLKYLVLVLST